MKKGPGVERALRGVSRFILFFIIVAFVVTCCMLLFLSTLAYTINVDFTSVNIGVAAKLTFINVVALSLILTVLDTLRRYFAVERPARDIIEAAERIMQGDFSARIDKRRFSLFGEKFSEIAECFNRMAEKLQGVETLRTDFVSNVSHELKTPMAVMHNYALMLKRGAHSEQEREEYIDAIYAASSSLASLISNILKLNKLENRQTSLQRTRYNLSEQVCECLLGFEDTWEKKNINIETDIEDDVFVFTDGEIMSIVWNNLISNALKFTDAGGTVFVSVASLGDTVSVTVKDTGCGIPKDVGERMFDKFYQVDTSRATEGNGLGLALVKRVIDITGCDISASSKVGVGTAFTVRMRRG